MLSCSVQQRRNLPAFRRYVVGGFRRRNLLEKLGFQRTTPSGRRINATEMDDRIWYAIGFDQCKIVCQQFFGRGCDCFWCDNQCIYE